VYKANMSAKQYQFDSQLLQQLRSAAWILDKAGHPRRPREVTFEDLPDDWQYPSNQSSLANKIGIGAEAELRRTREALKPSHAKALGVELEEIEEYKRWKAAGGTLENLREQTEALQREHEFPGASSEDPERRSAVATQDAVAAPDRRTEPRMRSVEVDRPQAVSESRTFLRQQYTNNAGDMFCQACRKLLPFKVKGEWYFEAVQFVTGLTKAHTANMLALCPLCAALYKHTRQTANDALVGSLLDQAVGVSQASVDIAVLLNNKRVELRFTGTHAIDLQAALRIAAEDD
jgi:hypothetical protein